MAQELTPSVYHRLVSDLARILVQGRQSALAAVNQTILKTYWDMGKRISASKELATGSQADTFFKQLANDLKMEPTLVYRINQFFRLWPNGIPSPGDANQISWSHFVELLSIRNDKERTFYLKEALAEGWSRDTLRKAIQQDLFTIHKHPERRKKALLPRPKNPFNVYKAIVENVVDGDTLLVRIDLGFDVWVNERTRFRGINASEVVKSGLPSGDNRARGEKAKQFVQEKLRRLPFIVLKTYKTDNYGRYVVDIFYHPTLSQKEAVYERGFFLNSQMVEKGLADLEL